MQAQEEQGNEILRDRNAISGITAVLAEDSERVQTALRLAEGHRGITRFARTQQADPEVMRNVSAVSMRDKLKIARSYHNAGNTRQTEGINCVFVKANGQAKKEFFPLAEKLQDWERCTLNEEIGYLKSKLGGRTNKGMEKVVGTTVHGDIYFFRICDEEIAELTPLDFETLFPKKVNWKCKVA